MKVLVACEESQRVCMEFRGLGHEAYSCDTQPCSGGHPEWHIQADVLPLLDGNCEFQTADGEVHRIDAKWDMIIGFPPCTYFSTAGASRLYHGGKLDKARYEKGLKMRKLFMAIYGADCKRIAIENPTPLKIWDLPKETQVIQPYDFGHPYSKRTCLWLKGLPPLFSTEIVWPYIPYVDGGNKRADGSHRRVRGKVRNQKDRSKTFPGIAKAMAEQWGQAEEGACPPSGSQCHGAVPPTHHSAGLCR